MLDKGLLRYAVLALVLLVFFTLNTWDYPLFDVDEPRYAETAREMITAPGDWITPYFNHVKRFDKPVLFYWLIALMYKVFGVSEFAARLVSALSATAIGLGLFYTASVDVAKKRAPSALPWLSVLVFATMLEPFFMARWAITDMTLTACMSLMGLGLYLGLMCNPRWYMAAGVCCGLGLLTKGPVALALPGLIYLLFAATRFKLHGVKWREHLLSGWFWGAIALALVIAAPWYLAVAQANPTEFIAEFVLKHNVQRFASTVSGHTGPWYYFIPVVLAGSIPWVAFLPAMLLRAVGHVKQGMITQWPPLVLYSLIGAVTVFLFFSVSNTKLLTYILPGFPAFAVVLAWVASTWFSSGLGVASDLEADSRAVQKTPAVWPLLERFSVQALLLLMGVGFTAAFAGTFMEVSAWLPSKVQAFYTPAPFRWTAAWMSVGLLLTNVFWFVKRGKAAVLLLGGSMVGFLILLSINITPLVAQMIQTDLIKAASLSKSHHAVLATYETKKPSLVFYTQDKVYFVPRREPEETTTDQLLYHDLQLPNRPLFLLVKNPLLSDVLTAYDTTLVNAGHAYSLVRINPGQHRRQFERKPPVDLTDLPNQ